jgi:WhiB family transcriptional regulator, redox-sensing transcriptional regulator
VTPRRPPSPAVVTEQPWMEFARCKGMDPNVFFPGHGDHDGMARAKAICAGCPVREACGAYCLVELPRGEQGVWGGLAANERRQMRRRKVAA